MLDMLFKRKDSKSERLPHFYENRNVKFKVKIRCIETKGTKDIELESISTHHHVLYTCACGETLKIAPIDFMYQSDSIQYAGKSIHAQHAVYADGGIKFLFDKIVTTFWEFG